MIYISAAVAQWPEMLSTSPENMSSIPDTYRMISSTPRIKINTSSDVEGQRWWKDLTIYFVSCHELGNLKALTSGFEYGINRLLIYTRMQIKIKTLTWKTSPNRPICNLQFKNKLLYSYIISD